MNSMNYFCGKGLCGKDMCEFACIHPEHFWKVPASGQGCPVPSSKVFFILLYPCSMSMYLYINIKNKENLQGERRFY